MKKILKTASLFIITITACFGFSLGVFADDACTGYEGCRLAPNRPNGRMLAFGSTGEYRGVKDATSTTKAVQKEGADVKGSDGTYKHFSFSKLGVTPYYNGASKSGRAFTAYSDTGNSYSSLYCLDAHKDGYATLYAERFLLDSSNGKKTMAFDYALMSILTTGSNFKNGDVASMQNYLAKLTAIRAVTITWGYYNLSNAEENFLAMFRTSFGLVDKWLAEDSSSYDQINASVGLVDKSVFKSYNKYYLTGDIIDSTAKTLYLNAMKEAALYLAGTESQGSVTSTTRVEDIKTTNVGSDIKVERDVIHTLKLSGFNKDSKFIINSDGNGGIKFADNTTYDGLKATIKQIRIQDGPVLGSFSPQEITNILDKDLVALGYIKENQDVEIEVTVHLEGYKQSAREAILQCGQQPIKYSIGGSLSNGTTSKYSGYVATVWYSNQENTQRYIGIEEGSNPTETPWTSEVEVPLIDACDCDDLINACVSTGYIGSAACKELLNSNCGECAYIEAACAIDTNSSQCDEEKYAQICEVTCETFVDTFECCDERGDLIISKSDDKEVSILGPGKDNINSPSITACFVSKIGSQKDNSGTGAEYEKKGYQGINGVEDQKGNSYTLKNNNKYCTVSCKEDYVMTMPTAKLTNAGRYFTFKAKINGTKTCYTNKIDIEQYNTDIEALIKDMEVAFNQYNKYKTADEAFSAGGGIGWNEKKYIKKGGCPFCATVGYWRGLATNLPYNSYSFIVNSGTNALLTSYRVSNYVSFYNYETEYVISNKSNIRGYSINFNGAVSYLYNSGVSNNMDDGGANGGGCCGTNCLGCSLGNAGSYRNDVRNSIIAYRDYWKDRFDYLEDKFNELQQQYKDCSNDSWSSELNYDPDVYYDYNEDYINQYNHVGQMDASVRYPTTDREWYCGVGALIGSNYDNCNGTTNKTAVDVRYVTCNLNTAICSEEVVRNMPTVQYVKKTSTVDAKYKPKTLFYNVYPSGEIVVNKADDNVALERNDSEGGTIGLLPVRLDTKRGIYKYTVNVENLGEFYNSTSRDNLGRYVGSSTAVVDPNKLVYNCSYIVNMPITDKDRLVCDFDDNCTDDCIADCVGPGCDSFCEGTDCVADCIGLGCIYDDDAGSSLIEKVVSLNNLFPNGTDSYNWNRNANNKAEETISTIEEKGNSVYNETPILSITVDPGTAREIKQYNKSVLNEGSYSNATLSCYKLGSHEEVACYSSFIQDILDGEYGNIVNSDNSKIADEYYRTGGNVAGNAGEYFERWTKGLSEDKMIGPAWK